MKMAVFWVVENTLMMETASTSETSAKFYQITRRNNPKDFAFFSILHTPLDLMIVYCNKNLVWQSQSHVTDTTQHCHKSYPSLSVSMQFVLGFTEIGPMRIKIKIVRCEVLTASRKMTAFRDSAP
jgi:hypothetical protein